MTDTPPAEQQDPSEMVAVSRARLDALEALSYHAASLLRDDGTSPVSIGALADDVAAVCVTSSARGGVFGPAADCPDCGRAAHPVVITTATELADLASCWEENGAESGDMQPLALVDRFGELWHLESWPNPGNEYTEPRLTCLTVGDEERGETIYIETYANTGKTSMRQAAPFPFHVLRVVDPGYPTVLAERRKADAEMHALMIKAMGDPND